MITINLTVWDKKLSLTNPDTLPELTTGSYGEFVCRFDFNGRWDGLTKSAVFYQKGYPSVRCPLDSNNECGMPAVLKTEDPLFLGVYGTVLSEDGETFDILISSRWLNLPVYAGAYDPEALPNDPPEADVYDMIVGMMQAQAVNASAAMKIANMQLNVTMLAPDAQPTVEKVETEDSIIFNIGTPKGPAGAGGITPVAGTDYPTHEQVNNYVDGYMGAFLVSLLGEEYL